MVGVMSVLDDKDASAMLVDAAAAVRRGRVHALLATAARCRRRRSRASRASVGGPAAQIEPSPRRGARACTRACGPRRRGRGDGLHISAVGPRARGHGEQLLTQHARMLGFVALVVAVVILLFFALGYGLGRLLL